MYWISDCNTVLNYSKSSLFWCWEYVMFVRAQVNPVDEVHKQAANTMYDYDDNNLLTYININVHTHTRIYSIVNITDSLYLEAHLDL